MNPKTVLIADDEMHVVHVLSLKLRQSGLTVLTAHNGEEAFELACRHKPDLVITDFQMPLMTGFELAVKLKQTPETAGLPVLMITARGHLLSNEDRDRTNIRAILSKPFGPRIVLEKVIEIIGDPASDAGPGERSAAAA